MKYIVQDREQDKHKLMLTEKSGLNKQQYTNKTPMLTKRTDRDRS